MVPALSLHTMVGLAAGALIVAVGAFVLAAKPKSGLHHLFFVFALVDGASTAFFRLSAAGLDPWWETYFYSVYWYYYLAFVAVLWIFALTFPTRTWDRRTTRAVVVGVVAAAGVLIVLHAWRRDLFWSAGLRQDGGFFVPTPLGNLVTLAFAAAVAFLLLKLTRSFTRTPSPSRRNQATYVLAGLVLAYAPQWSTQAVRALLTDPVANFLERPLHVVLLYWTFLFVTIAVLVAAARLLVGGDRALRAARRFALACFGGVAAVTLATAVAPTAEWTSFLRTLGLLAYPLVLGYAILRYEVFDIDRQLRRGATVTIFVAAAVGTFVVVQNAFEGALQDAVFAGLTSEFVAGSVAAVATTVLSLPIVRAARHVSRRVIPDLSKDELHGRKLEVYRHSLEGALADGLLEDRESRTLSALRTSLGVTEEEHARLAREVAGAMHAGPLAPTSG